MTIGIRTKLVLMMVAVALLPLLAALSIIVVGGKKLHMETFGQGALACVSSRADSIENHIVRDIHLLEVSLHNSLIANVLKRNETGRPRGVKGGENSDAISEVIDRILQGRGFLGAALIGRAGEVVYSSLPEFETDFQGATWLDRCSNDGDGMIYLSRVEPCNRGGFTRIGVPLFGEGRVVGVAVVYVSLEKWIGDCTVAWGDYDMELFLINDNGSIMYCNDIRKGTSGYASGMHTYPGIGSQAWESGGVLKDAERNRLEAISFIRIPRRIEGIETEMPRWRLVASINMTVVEKQVAHLGAIFVLVGLSIIISVFLIGVFVIDRRIIKRIRRLSSRAKKVAEGDLDTRILPSHAGSRILGFDEIDDLGIDLNNMVQKLRRTHEELEESVELKENFIRIAGHELRTPVSYIIGMATLMKSTDNVGRLTDAMETIRFKASRLDEIIQAMFKLIPEKNLKEELSLSWINVAELIERVKEDCRHWINRRRQHLDIVTDIGEEQIYADKNKLVDIVMNLAMNAVKFTPDEGAVTISIQKELGEKISIAVTDEGPGIPEKDRPHVFEPFYSGGEVLRHSTGKSGFHKKGMGLGLAIVKHFVELHRGNVDFTTGTAGTTFTVWLPIRPGNE